MNFARNREELTGSNVSGRFLLAESLEIPPLAEIDFLASHFSQVNLDVLKSLSHSCLQEVLRSPKLQILSEDSLLDSILELGRDYFELLGTLRSEYLSVTGIDRLLNAISIEEVDGELWSSLCRRLRLFVKPSSIPEFRFCLKQFNLDQSRPFDGIISSLTRSSGVNVHTKGIVSITASTNSRNQCHQVVDYDWTGFWYSQGYANSWIQFDFKGRKISVTHYSIKSAGNSCHYLLQWSLEGSNDSTSWTRLDQRNTQDLNGNYIVKSYECGSPQPSCFQFIRLTHTGANSSNCHNLMLSNVEFFGVLDDNSEMP
jgi:hypothetical protein